MGHRGGLIGSRGGHPTSWSWSLLHCRRRHHDGHHRGEPRPVCLLTVKRPKQGNNGHVAVSNISIHISSVVLCFSSFGRYSRSSSSYLWRRICELSSRVLKI